MGDDSDGMKSTLTGDKINQCLGTCSIIPFYYNKLVRLSLRFEGQDVGSLHRFK
jgi:hypothetical protein